MVHHDGGPMVRATIRGIVAHRVRLVLSLVAIVLGVAFVAGTYVLTDTLDRSYDGLFRDTYADVDVVVRLEGQSGPEGTRERFAESVVDEVARVPGVASAHAVVQGFAQFVDRDGEAIRKGGAPTLAISWAQDGARGPLRLIGRDSRPPEGPDEVAMDVDTARAHGFAVGDRVRVLLTGPAREFRISGLFGFADRIDLGAVTFAAFDPDTAQEAVGAPGQVDAVNVVVEPGETVDAVRSRVARAVGPGYSVVVAADAADDAGAAVRDVVQVLTAFLLAFAGVGVVIAALLVFNTFTIVVAQRARELGLLRVLGASRAQVIASILAEAVVVGVVGSVIGLVLGVVGATALLALVEELGFDIPDVGVVVSARTVVMAGGIGVVVAVLAALWPALRASRARPLEAFDDTPAAPRGVSVLRVGLGLALLLAALLVLQVGLDQTEGARRLTGDLGWVAVGVVVLLASVAVLLAAVAGPVAGALGRVGARRSPSAALARENVVRNPRRTAATAMAMVIGLTVVTAVAVFGSSAKASVRRAVDGGIRADVILKAEQFAGFSPEVAERVSEVPGVRAVSPLQFRKVRIHGNEETVASATAPGLAPTVDLELAAGEVASLGDDGILVHEDAADDYGFALGDTVLVQMSRGYYPLTVGGIYRQADFTGGLPISWIVPRDVYLEGFGTDEQDTLVYVRAAGDPDAAAARIDRALRRDFPNVEVLTRAEYRAEQGRAIDRFLAVSVALLLLAEIIAVLGIVNTLALSVFERTREIGLLRAVGMARDQVRTMVRREAVVIAGFGALVGIGVGLVWGWVFVRALGSQGLTVFAVPWWLVASFLVVALLAGVVAAWLPARRASRLDVLEAIARP